MKSYFTITKTYFDEYSRVARKFMLLIGLKEADYDALSKRTKEHLMFVKHSPYRIKAEKGSHVSRYYIKFFNYVTAEYERKTFYGDPKFNIRYVEYLTYGLSLIFSIRNYDTDDNYWTDDQIELLEKIKTPLVQFTTENEQDHYAIRANEILKYLFMYVSQPNFRYYTYKEAGRPIYSKGIFENLLIVSSIESEIKRFVIDGKSHPAYRLQYYSMYPDVDGTAPEKAYLDIDLLLNTNSNSSTLVLNSENTANLIPVYIQTHALNSYHVNWLQNALPLPDDGKPLLVSVLGTDLQLLDKPIMKPLLRRIFTRHPTVICPNADWMVAPLQSAFGDVARVVFTPFGIDPMWYTIRREENMWSIPPRWLAVTRLTRAKLGPLLEWGEPLFRDQSREIHLFGPMQENIPLPDWVHYHGPASPDTLCRNEFPKAHGLITLSRHAEGRPQVMLEAMAAGLPIVASHLPAHENIVVHGETGWLCDSAEDVGRGLKHYEAADQNLRAGQAARTWVSQEIGTWDDCAARYATQYEALSGSHAHE